MNPEEQMPRPDGYVLLRRDGVAVLLDLRQGLLPAVQHWGADLGPLDCAAAESLSRAGVGVPGPSTVDSPVRLSMLPEHWTGWVGRPGLEGSRSGRDWSPRFVTTQVWVGSALLAAAGDSPLLITSGADTVRVVATDPDAGLGLQLLIELTAGGVLRSRAILTNDGADDYALGSLQLVYPVPGSASELLDLAGRWAKERTPQRRAFTVGTHLREGRKGRTGPDAATVLHAGTCGFGFASGEVWGVHVGWSGNHRLYAERLSTGEQVLGGGELLLPGEVVLGPGKSYETPWLYGVHGNGLDGVAGRFHTFLRSRPQHPGPARPVTLNVWEAVYFDHSLPPLLELADLAAGIGVERFVLDDGWFGSRRCDRAGLGDWTVSAEVWPDGLHPLADRVVELGMEFGLWMEPEMVNLDSDVARQHPEWIMTTGSRMPVSARHQQVLNLAIPECYERVRDQLSAVLDEYPISYVKWDHNRDLIDAGFHSSGRPAVHEQTFAAYRLIDELKAAHPGLEVESCSSGGARLDLGILERTDRVWASDCIDPHERQQILLWTLQLIPPELIGSHIASAVSHTTGRSHSLGFRASTAIFGHLGVEWDLRQATPAELSELRDWISFYKDNRELLCGGRTVRIDHPDRALRGLGMVASDQASAIYSLATVERSDVVSVGRVRLPGLDRDGRYRVTPVRVGPLPAGCAAPPWWESELVLPGSALVDGGITLPSLNPDESVLYRVEAT